MKSSSSKLSCKCPSCRVVHSETHTKCPECDFGFAILDNYYSQFYTATPPIEAKALTDNAGILNAKERADCSRMLSSFSERFPGLFFSVYLDSSRDFEEADSKSLWILNRAHFTNMPEAAHSQHGILLYIDANKRSAAISYGSALDSYITPRDTFSFLKASHPDFFRRRYLNAIKKTVHKTTSHLVSKCPVFKKSQSSLSPTT